MTYRYTCEACQRTIESHTRRVNALCGKCKALRRVRVVVYCVVPHCGKPIVTFSKSRSKQIKTCSPQCAKYNYQSVGIESHKRLGPIHLRGAAR